MIRITRFNYADHNKKIAKLRGKSWKSALRQAKLRKTKVLTNLKLARNEKGLSQREILPHIGVRSQATYHRIEQGKSEVPFKKAQKIANFLDTPLDKLFVKVSNDKYLVI